MGVREGEEIAQDDALEMREAPSPTEQQDIGTTNEVMEDDDLPF